MGKLFIVDDDRGILEGLRVVLEGEGHEVIAAESGDKAVELVPERKPDVLIMDIRMPGIGGLEAFGRIRKSRPKMPVIIMTGFSTTEDAIEATKLGAYDYVLKPFDPEMMLHKINSALQCVRLMDRPIALDLTPVPTEADAIIGQSEEMQQVYRLIGQVAQTDATVLIRGETGTGKELVARAIYQHSRRSEAPLVVVNCVAIPEALLESELFGHEKGSFTGATHRRIGKFEQASGGTILLDEIGDMPLSIQAKCLRVLERKTFERIGSNETIKTDVRVIALTNQDLEKGISEKTFREDLFHRLNVVTIRIPPLREHSEDIPRLTDYFLTRYAAELGINPPLLSDDARELLTRHSWRGNVRELEHCLHRAIIFTRGYPIQKQDILSALESSQTGREVPASQSVGDLLKEIVQGYLRTHSGSGTFSEFIERVEQLLLAEALRLSKGNQTQAAKHLGLARPTLKWKMDRCDPLGAPDSHSDLCQFLFPPVSILTLPPRKRGSSTLAKKKPISKELGMLESSCLTSLYWHERCSFPLELSICSLEVL